MCKVRMHPHNKMCNIYVPTKVVRALHLENGDDVEFLETEDYSSEIDGAKCYIFKKKGVESNGKMG